MENQGTPNQLKNFGNPESKKVVVLICLLLLAAALGFLAYRYMAEGFFNFTSRRLVEIRIGYGAFNLPERQIYWSNGWRLQEKTGRGKIKGSYSLRYVGTKEIQAFNMALRNVNVEAYDAAGECSEKTAAGEIEFVVPEAEVTIMSLTSGISIRPALNPCEGRVLADVNRTWVEVAP